MKSERFCFILLLGLIIGRSQTGQGCNREWWGLWSSYREQSLSKGMYTFWKNVELNKTHLWGNIEHTNDKFGTPDLSE